MTHETLVDTHQCRNAWARYTYEADKDMQNDFEQSRQFLSEPFYDQLSNKEGFN